MTGLRYNRKYHRWEIWQNGRRIYWTVIPKNVDIMLIRKETAHIAVHYYGLNEKDVEA